MATLYIVGTPIGNLEDLTFRAKRILSTVSVVACEDTRVTKKLLHHYQIAIPTISLHHHSSLAHIDHILQRVHHGQDVAVVTDAGMPGLADPGGKVVQRAMDQGIKIECVPGPSALSAAVSLSGLPTDRFLFLGFLPHKKGRETVFKRIAATEETVILYESPHRLMKTLDSLMRIVLNKQIVVCRELTKFHESVARGSAEEVLKYFQEHADEVRGEIVMIIGPS